MLEQQVTLQLQPFLAETDYMDLFQSSFRPSFGREAALVALMDALCLEKDRESAALLILLDLSTAFETARLGVLPDKIFGFRMGSIVLQ